MNTQKKLENILFIAWATAFIATSSSLYLSEIMKYEPCTLCWYQRIFMYPLVIILGIAITNKDYKISIYGLILSTIGISISTYHYSIQKIPQLSNISTCGRIPCTDDYLNWFGFITIPFLCLIAFLIIIICSTAIININKKCY
ncbi:MULTISPECIES: disulfide oxidoreductase [Bacillus]|uniref:disulfide oxidoreductase n=1 Tax=Bacillus TaxID=1386 RepID=UPI00091B17E4|nr:MULTISPECIES: disulfide oxidoreductase [Bacillus]MED3269751.1 disulfide oxidoreductase [Bacillus thuringiensis]PFA83817.1 disulfide bond formation protein B [Bacillus thuringiensis]PFB40325.1 disulfide bond formation protein B [Bacillus thuringiensis]PFE91138.1 disulfide bond formation protein B [Bacillus thuringiensis]PFV38512.1 disulfide bond formation protein B [Bacillus thuringiensis]